MTMETGDVAAFIAAAVLLAVLALSAALHPLLRRRKAAGMGLVVAMILLVGGLYFVIGTPSALDPAMRVAPPTLDSAIARLETELARGTNQPEGWRLLASAYRAEGRTADVARAYDEALRLAPRDPDILAETAEARALAAPARKFDARAVALLERALAIDPAHQRARWFLGVAQRQAGQPAAAAATWARLLDSVEPSTAQALRGQIASARQDAGLPPLPDASAAAGLDVEVRLAPTIAASVKPGAVLFVIAREPGGAPMPVAVKRLVVTMFPVRVRLTDADGPMPTRRLSQLRSVEVSARLSASGVANARTGDPESVPVTAASGGRATVIIDRMR